jgi:hypothetical protein
LPARACVCVCCVRACVCFWFANRESEHMKGKRLQHWGRTKVMQPPRTRLSHFLGSGASAVQASSAASRRAAHVLSATSCRTRSVIVLKTSSRVRSELTENMRVMASSPSATTVPPWA